jgi:site-specific DNA recombinase
MRYLIYCRKSTDTEDKQVLSLDSQENELTRIAGTQGLQVVGILREAMSAKSVGRPVFDQLLKMIAAGKADAILCWKLDRLARNMVDGGSVMDLLQKSTIKEIRTYESIHLPADNVLMLAVHFGMANQYIRDLSTNVKRGNRAKLERGEWPNKAPFGYYNDKATKTVKVDKQQARYVVRAYELYATGGYSINQIRDVLQKEGLRTSTGNKIGKNHVHRLFLTKFYLGLMERDGIVYVGKHKPIIPTALYDRAQDVLHGRLHPKPKKHSYSARGFLKCGSCGCALTADTQKGFQYYYCTNGKGVCEEHKKYMRSKVVDGLLSQMFLDLRFDEELIELSAEAYKARNKDKLEYVQGARDSIVKELESLTERESVLTDGYASQIIRKDLYELKMRELSNRQTELTKQLSELEVRGGVSVGTFERIREIFLEGSRAAKEYLEVDDAKKRRMLEKLLSNASIKNQNVISYQYKSPYQALAKAPKNGDLCSMLRDLDSNQDKRIQSPLSYH